MKHPKRSQLLAANTAGVLGYFGCLMQWLWTAVVFLPGLIETDQFKSLFLSSPNSVQPTPRTLPAEASPFMLLLAGVITIAMIAVTLYILWKLPTDIAKSGHKVTATVTSTALPVITHHKKVSAAKKRTLTFNLSFSVKFFFVLLPYLLLFLPPLGTHTLDGQIIWTIGTFFACSALLWFAVQYLLGRIFSLPPSKLL